MRVLMWMTGRRQPANQYAALGVQPAWWLRTARMSRYTVGGVSNQEMANAQLAIVETSPDTRLLGRKNVA